MKACWLALLLVSATAQAQFNLKGKVKLDPVDGMAMEQPFSFSFQPENGAHRFTVASQSLLVNSVPQKYSLALIQQQEHLWVPDFSDTPLKGFDLNVAGHEVLLYRDNSQKSPHFGLFVLMVDGERYLFHRGPGQVNFYFTDNGVKEVQVKGMLKPGPG